MTKYILLVRTAEAEIRAIENTDDSTLSKLTPLIEITRGRKKVVGNIATYPFTKRLEKLKKKLNGLEVMIDLTSDERLSCEEVNALYDYNDGYAAWTSFLRGLKQEGCFRNIIPALLMNFNDSDFEANLRKQIADLCSVFDILLYHGTIEDTGCYEDIPLILENMPERKKLIVLIDCGYTPQAMMNNMLDKLKARIGNLKSNSITDERCAIAFCATSFPNNISEIGQQDQDEFIISEVRMHEELLKVYPDIVYGDYGSVNPIRNDTIVMARGWIPRIDVPLKDVVFYRRKRRQGASYTDTYRQVANMVVRAEKFPADLNVWGTQQIRTCTTTPPSSAPSFWISVRVNIHIEQQVKRLASLNGGVG